MNKLKNIGISALAGTLVSLSAAQAGGVSVTGAWELNYTNKHSEKVTGNKLGVKKNVGFGASGDLSDGGGVTWATTVGMSDAFGLSSASMNINMGGIATLAYDSGTGGYGANAVDNIVPTAWEEIDYGLSTGITDLGAVSASKGVVNLTIKSPGSGTGISLSYASRVGGSHQADGATGSDTGSNRGFDAVIDLVDVSEPQFGFRLGLAGEFTQKRVTCEGDNQIPVQSCNAGHKGHPYGLSAYTKFALGPLHVGTQATFKDPREAAEDGIRNKRSIVAGAALVFGDTLSLSYGEAWDKYRYNNALRGDIAGTTGGSEEYATIRYHGWSAAMNLGPVALKATRNRVGGWGENAGNTGRGIDKTHSEVNLSIAF